MTTDLQDHTLHCNDFQNSCKTRNISVGNRRCTSHDNVEVSLLLRILGPNLWHVQAFHYIRFLLGNVRNVVLRKLKRSYDIRETVFVFYTLIKIVIIFYVKRYIFLVCTCRRFKNMIIIFHGKPNKYNITT